MKFRISSVMLIALSIMVAAQEAELPSRFLVYNLSSRIFGVGKEFADELFVDLGEERDSWRGKLLIDTEGSPQSDRVDAAIFWYTIQDGERVMQVIDLSGGLLNQTIAQRRGFENQIYSLSTARNRGSYPNGESLNLVFFEGSRARLTDIGSDADELVSFALRGEFWLLDATTESYRWGRLRARFDRRETYDANDLGDYATPLDGIVDLDDVVAWYQNELRTRGYRAIPE